MTLQLADFEAGQNSPAHILLIRNFPFMQWSNLVYSVRSRCKMNKSTVLVRSHRALALTGIRQQAVLWVLLTLATRLVASLKSRKVACFELRSYDLTLNFLNFLCHLGRGRTAPLILLWFFVFFFTLNFFARKGTTTSLSSPQSSPIP